MAPSPLENALNSANRKDAEFSKRLAGSNNRELAALTIPTQGLKKAPPARLFKRRGAELKSPSTVLKKHQTASRRTVTPVTKNVLLQEEHSDDDTVIEGEEVLEGANIADLEQVPLDFSFLDSDSYISPKTSKYSSRCSDIDQAALFQDETTTMAPTLRQRKEAATEPAQGHGADSEMIQVERGTWETLRNRLIKYQKDNKELAERANNCGKACQAAYAENDSLKTTLKKLTDVPASAKEEIQTLIKQIGALRANLVDFKTVNDQLSKTEKAAMVEEVKLKSRILELEKQIKQEKDKASAIEEVAQSTNSQQVDEGLALELDNAKKEITLLKRLIEKLRQTIEEYQKELGKNNLNLPSEMSKIGQKKVREFCRDVCMHDTPFVTSVGDKEVLIKRIYKGIKDDPELGYSNQEDPDTYMDISEFARIYGKHCVEQLNQQRQNVVTKLLIAATDFFRLFKRIPTEQDLLDVYKPLPKEEDDNKAYKVRRAIKLWYFDQWLPSLSSAYAEDIRYYNLATATKEIGGMKLPFVTVQLEAFGITALKNNTPKWNAIAPLRAEHGNSWKVPARGKANSRFHDTKWSSGSQGKANKGLGGWHQDAYKDWYSNQETIDAIRKKDSNQGWKMYKQGRQLMRVHHNVQDKEPPQKKRKVNKDGALAKHSEEVVFLPPQLSNTVFKDDEEDHFSIHSECSSGENNRGGARVEVTATDADGNAVGGRIS